MGVVGFPLQNKKQNKTNKNMTTVKYQDRLIF